MDLNFSAFEDIWTNLSFELINFTSEDTAPKVTDYAKNTIQQATEAINICGVIINGAFAFLLIAMLATSSDFRILSRLWLLLGIITSDLFNVIFLVITHSLGVTSKVWTNDFTCAIIQNLSLCLDFVAVLCSVLLVFHILLWVKAAGSEKGQGSRLFWILSESAAWLLGFIVVLAIRAWSAEVVEIEAIRASFCTYTFSSFVPIIYSCITLLLPYLFAFPVAVCSLVCSVRLKSRNKLDDSVPFALKSGGRQYSAIESEDDLSSSTDNQNKDTLLLWVIFNAVNVLFGFSCRLPLHIFEQEFFLDDLNFNPQKVWWIFNMIYGIYISFMPLFCLMLEEVRSVFLQGYKLARRCRSSE